MILVRFAFQSLLVTTIVYLQSVKPSMSFQVLVSTRQNSKRGFKNPYPAPRNPVLFQIASNGRDIDDGEKMENLPKSLDQVGDTTTRRQMLVSSSKLLLVGTAAEVFAGDNAWAADSKWGATPDHPVAILGGGGGTGREVARALAREGIYAVTMTRTGMDPYQAVKLKPEIKTYLNHFPDPVNVVDSTGLKQALTTVQASAIIFCASASKQGGNAFQVDDQGVGNAAAVAKDLGARLVVVSALAVDRPDSKSFKITNTLGGSFNGIMDAKRSGEQRVRDTLSKSKDYVIVRPGPLMSGKSYTGPSGIQLNQGDTIGGGLSRDELAGVVVGALVSGTRGATVEVYRTATATALQKDFAVPSGNERTADSYLGLFQSLLAD